MAEVQYFPPLDKCLAGRDRLIPWKTTYRALCDLPTALRSATLEHFLNTSEAIDILANPLAPFPEPSQPSKTKFDTRTAPIHVAQSSSGDYDLEQLKKDALWLAQTVKVEEEAALRIAIVEWQERDKDQLVSSTVRPVESSLQGGSMLGASALGRSTAVFAASVGAPARTGSDGGREQIRRDRVLELYLEERQAVLSISTDLVGQYVIANEVETSATGTWLQNLAAKIVAEQHDRATCRDSPAEAAKSKQERRIDGVAFLREAIEAVQDCMERLNDRSMRPNVFSLAPEKQELYVSATLVHMNDILRLMLAHLHSLDRLPEPTMITAWFVLMAECAFMQHLQPTATLQNVDILQHLAALVSLAMLQLPKAVTRVHEVIDASRRAGAKYPDLGSKLYIDDEGCVQALNKIMYDAARNNVVLAAPAIYAWSLVTKLIRDGAEGMRLRRENVDQQRHEDGGSSDTETGDATAGRGVGDGSETDIEKRWAWFHQPEMEDARDDPARYLAVAAVDGTDVYSLMTSCSRTVTGAYGAELSFPTALVARERLYDLLRQGLDLVGYDVPVMDALLAVLSPDLAPKDTQLFGLLATRFLADTEGFRAAILDQALARYPYELSPLLRLCTALSAAEAPYPGGPPQVVQILENLQTVTLMVPEDFRSYTLENEDENANALVLTNDLAIFLPKRRETFYGEGRFLMDREVRDAEQEGVRNVLLIPAGTPGMVIREERPMVLTLRHPHSGLEYIGLLLSTLLPGSELVPSILGASETDKTTAAEIIILITVSLTAALKQQQGPEEARFVLGRLGFALHDETDIVAVIAELFELELLSFLAQDAGPGSLELCIACVEFLGKLTYVSPERVWSWLARSSLLGFSGGASAMAAVIGAVEAQTGSFAFLVTCAKLYAECLRDAVAGLVKRKGRQPRGGGRFDSPMQGLDDTPERTVSLVLKGYTRVLLDVLRDMGSWRFVVVEEKSAVLECVVETFERLVRWTYGLEKPVEGEAGRQKEKMTAVLVAAAETVLDAFAPLAGDGATPLLETLGAAFAEALGVGDERLPLTHREALIGQTRILCGFLTRLLRTARIVEPQRAFGLANQLLKVIPMLSVLYALDPAWRSDMSVYMKELVRGLACIAADPQPFLSGLTTEAAKSFLSVVSDLDRPLRDFSLECEVWSFLTAVLESRQQWFGMYLLTGTLPRDRLRTSTTTAKGTADAKGKPLLDYALDELANIAQIVPSRAKAMLRFVAAAQRSWVWATLTVRSHADFLKNALAWMEEIRAPSRGGKNVDHEVSASEHQAAAHLCDVLAVSLHAGLETGDKTVLKMVVGSRLGFLAQHGVGVNAYNRSLHRNLAENLARKFVGVELADFKRAVVNNAEHGGLFTYDYEIAEIVLGYQPLAWEGNGERGTQGFAAEFLRANMNLSLVDAQTSLLRSWGTLATTLSECVGMEDAAQEPLIATVKACIEANAKAGIDEPGTSEVLQLRADIAFVVLSKLVGVGCAKVGMKELLVREVQGESEQRRWEPGAWDLVRMSPVDFDVATAREDLRYYRTLLQILFLAIRPHVYIPLTKPVKGDGKASLSAEVASVLVDIVAKTIAPGFWALCGNLHAEDMALASPADFALITALLQAVLAVQGIGIAHLPLATAIADSSLVRGALSLYSWADQLAEVMDDDPIYGEVAITTLVTLSGIPQVAEQMALQGVLLQLSGANLSNHFRKPGGKGQWDEPMRMFAAIWTEGFLPLCLNLLGAVGPAIAGEVSAFLNSFPEQLKRAEEAFRSDGPGIYKRGRQQQHSGDVTLRLVREAHALVLIALTLQSDLARAAADGITATEVVPLQYDLDNARQEVGKLVRSQRSLADKVVAVNQRELAWAASVMEDVPEQQQLLPAAVDYRAKHTPNKVYAALPKGDYLEDGFFDLTYAAFARAIDAMAWWLDSVLGSKPAGTRFDDLATVPYVGPDDFRYVLLIHATMKTGRKIMYPFPANTPEGLVRLLELSKCEVVLASASHKHVWTEPLKQRPEMRLIEVPEIGEFVHDKQVEPYLYERTLDEGIEDPQLLIQTSGTTGQPKPIVLKSRWIKEYIVNDARRSRQASPSQKMAVYSLVEDTYCPSLLSLSWAAGVAMTAWFPLFTGQVPVMLPVKSMARPLTAEYIKSIGKHGPRGKRNGIILVPDVLRLLARDLEGRQSLELYDWVGYVGAPLDHETGDAITAMGVRVQSFIGSTDTGLYNILLNDPKDWKMHRFPDSDHGFYMEHYHDDLHELCTKRQADDPRQVFVNSPAMEIYHTRDLWRAAPGRKGYWMNAGRVDDFVKLSSMTKFNAITIEQIVEADGTVAKCVVAGDSRKKPFILVEPAPQFGPYDSTPVQEIVDRVWPAVEAANEHLLPEARLTKELTVITQPGKPIILTAKGTVSRRATLEMYEQAIEAAYAAAGYEPVPFTVTGEATAQVNGHADGHAR
ncbi:hypothetical protein B0A55_07778 [Friedmanniomyces simplex]|uniref:Uncharacterized protein n=1 Tax=Friedmanniomyces simplex TaxID=329884 RepID=A0A4U0XBI7_9PEZI|nr:hypothetical protein B0A55_07778 [Friedmanniomyces simplex]